MHAQLHSAPLAQMHPETLYRVLQLRTDVFVVEQNCPYPELDGRDLEEDTRIVWATEGEGLGDPLGDENVAKCAVTATLRILRDPDALRIGRVTAHPERRGSGLAARLFEFALDQCAELAPELPIVLDAQQPLEGWYARYGFVRTGEMFLEDDIPHVPMRREPGYSPR